MTDTADLINRLLTPPITLRTGKEAAHAITDMSRALAQVSLDELRKLDAVVHILGIEDSEDDPSEVCRQLMDSNEELIRSHNALLIDGAKWQKRAEDAEAALSAHAQEDLPLSEPERLNVTDGDREFASQILEDFSTFEEGIENQEKLAQWIRNVRTSAIRGVAQPPAMAKSEWFCEWLQGYLTPVTGQDELDAFDANTIRNTLNEVMGSPSLTSTHQSPPVFKASQQAESDPAVTPDCAGGDTGIADHPDLQKAYSALTATVSGGAAK
jgi:hypothetical protein